MLQERTFLKIFNYNTWSTQSDNYTGKYVSSYLSDMRLETYGFRSESVH